MRIYACDFLKNEECPKTSCQEFCFATTKKKYARRNARGEPIVHEMLADDAKMTPERVFNAYKEQ